MLKLKRYLKKEKSYPVEQVINEKERTRIQQTARVDLCLTTPSKAKPATIAIAVCMPGIPDTNKDFKA